MKSAPRKQLTMINGVRYLSSVRASAPPLVGRGVSVAFVVGAPVVTVAVAVAVAEVVVGT